MKKILAILLLAAMLLSLCACGKKSEPEIPQTTLPAAPVVTSDMVITTQDPNTVHVQRTPEPERTPAPAETPKPNTTVATTPAPTPTVAQPVGTPVVTTPQPLEPTTAPVVPSVSISSNSAVYSIVDQAGTYTDSLGNTYNYQYKVPAFGCTGPDTELLSEELYNAVMPTVNAELNAMQAGNSLTVTRTDYATYANGRYVSVVCSFYYPDGSCGYKVVNLNSDTGFRATNSELLQYAGISETDFASLAAQAAGSKFVELYGQPGDEQLTQAYNSTVNGVSLADSALFINSSGKIAFPAKIYSVAGAAYYQYIIVI